MLISVHVAKTGGTTFRTILRSHFGDRLFLDYEDRPLTKNSIIRKLSTLKGAAKARLKREKFECIHGHFLPLKYNLFNRRNTFIIWLRDPAQRIVSHYWFRMRTLDATWNPAFLAENLTLERFCSFPRIQNMYSKYLWGMEIDDFSFVGITEKFDRSIEIFCSQFGISQPDTLNTENKNPDSSSISYDIDPELLDFIHKVNHEDYAIYKRALQINQELEQRYLNL